MVVTQLAGSLILVNSNIHLYALHDEVVRLVSGVCSSSRNVDAEDVEIVLNFLRELAQKYSGFEYVRATITSFYCNNVITCTYMHVYMYMYHE